MNKEYNYIEFSYLFMNKVSAVRQFKIYFLIFNEKDYDFLKTIIL